MHVRLAPPKVIEYNNTSSVVRRICPDLVSILFYEQALSDRISTKHRAFYEISVCCGNRFSTEQVTSCHFILAKFGIWGTPDSNSRLSAFPAENMDSLVIKRRAYTLSAETWYQVEMQVLFALQVLWRRIQDMLQRWQSMEILWRIFWIRSCYCDKTEVYRSPWNWAIRNFLIPLSMYDTWQATLPNLPLLPLSSFFM